MVNLSRWRYDGHMLWGMCQGHEKLADGTYIHTSPVTKIELCDEGLDVFTHSGTHYRCKTEEISLDFLKETKMCLEKKEVNTAFLDNAAELVKKIEEEKFAEVKKLLKENDLYLEFLGVNLNHAYFKKNGVLIPLTVACHVGMFQDSYLIREPGVVDVRYFDQMFGVDFYHVSDHINNFHFKHVGEYPFSVSGIGDGLKFEKDDTEIKTIKPVNCKEGLISPDCVNGKSALLTPADKEEE